jgi:glucuronokinase
MIIRSKAFARAALIGNPSDGYFGKTIAFTFDNFAAEVVLYESPDLEILQNHRDASVFTSIGALSEDVRLFGYYGGIRLLKAAIKRFHDYCGVQGIKLHDSNFTVRYDSNIPNLVGLAGSSAIITACFRALMEFYGVKIPKPELANLILSVERNELGISAGLQDRVIQVYEGLVYMDFDRELMRAQGYGLYEELDVATLPPLYIAYRTDLSEMSDVFHNNIRGRFEQGETKVVEAMRFWAELTDKARAALEGGRVDDLSRLLDANFDRRGDIYRLSDGNLRMVRIARECGVSAKFTGSGGAIVGVCPCETVFAELKRRLEDYQVRVIRPNIVRLHR